jgi:hypothetical protein
MRRLILTTAALLALASPYASAEEPAFEQTRESYVAAVEPICQANVRASGRILAGVEAEVRHDKLKPAAAKFAKAAGALKKTWRQLSAVPQPSADEAKLGKWLGYIEAETELLQRTAKRLRAGDKVGALRMSIHLTVTVNHANIQVVAFEFHYCHADPSQFT